jgi:repressor LexA
MRPLTERQIDIINFIRAFVASNKYPPTFREISDHYQISARGAYDHLKALQTKGVVRWDKSRARSIELLDDPYPAPDQEKLHIRMIPLLGTVVAGTPLSSEENFDGYIELPNSMLGSGEYFALRVKGDSMIGAGIQAGDLAIIRSQETANNGDIVVAMVEEGITLKRFYKEANRVHLKAENPAYPPIYTRDLRILGKLSHLQRSY